MLNGITLEKGKISKTYFKKDDKWLVHIKPSSPAYSFKEKTYKAFDNDDRLIDYINNKSHHNWTIIG